MLILDFRARAFRCTSHCFKQGPMKKKKKPINKRIVSVLGINVNTNIKRIDQTSVRSFIAQKMLMSLARRRVLTSQRGTRQRKCKTIKQAVVNIVEHRSKRQREFGKLTSASCNSVLAVYHCYSNARPVPPVVELVSLVAARDTRRVRFQRPVRDDAARFLICGHLVPGWSSVAEWNAGRHFSALNALNAHGAAWRGTTRLTWRRNSRHEPGTWR